MANLQSDDSSEIEITCLNTNKNDSFLVPKDIASSKSTTLREMLKNTNPDDPKVSIDVDEVAFRVVMEYLVKGRESIDFYNVLPTTKAADYLGMEDLLNKCRDFFFKNFTINQLPIVIDFLPVTNRNTFINKKKVDCFIERHFLKIANTPSFLLFPLKTIEYILELDVIVDSEFRIFEAIIRWIEHDNNRKSHLSDLSKFIRWSHLTELEMIMINNHPLVMEMLLTFKANSSLENGSTNRVSSKFLVEVYEMNDTIKVFIYPNENKGPLAEFALCNEISDSIFTYGYIVDIIYDSGRKGIRLDCENKKYKYLNMFGGIDSYYGQIVSYIMDYPIGEESDVYFKHISGEKLEFFETSFDSTQCIMDLGSRFAAVTLYKFFNLDNNRFRTNVAYEIVKNKKVFNDHVKSSEYHVCLIQGVVYLLEKSFTLFQFDLIDKNWKKCKFIDEKGLNFESLELINNNDKLWVCDKSSKKIYEYQTFSDNWCCIKQIGLEDGSNLIAIVSVSLPKFFTST